MKAIRPQKHSGNNQPHNLRNAQAIQQHGRKKNHAQHHGKNERWICQRETKHRRKFHKSISNHKTVNETSPVLLDKFHTTSKNKLFTYETSMNIEIHQKP